MIHVGETTNSNAFEAGREIASKAMRQMPAGAAPGWALVFCGGHHSAEEVLRGVRVELGDAPIVGGAALGALTNDLLGSTGYECGLALFPDSLGAVDVAVAEGLDKDEHQAGLELGAKLRAVADDESTVLVFYDSVKSGPPPVLHVGSRLMQGIYAGLQDVQPTIVGAGTLADLEMTHSYVFDGRAPVKHAAVAVVMPASLDSHTTIMHGCFPASSFLEVTRIDGATVYELDGRPAIEVLAEKLGITPDGLASQQLSLALTLGEKYGDPFAPFDETKYVNRLVVSASPEDGSVTLFEADFHAGTRVQLMVTDLERMASSAEAQTGSLLASIQDREPVFGLYIDCAGRSPAFSGAEVVEAAIVQRQVGARCPLLGFYSGVEIAPLLGQSRPLDWTGVLTVFTCR